MILTGRKLAAESAALAAQSSFIAYPDSLALVPETGDEACDVLQVGSCQAEPVAGVLIVIQTGVLLQGLLGVEPLQGYHHREAGLEQAVEEDLDVCVQGEVLDPDEGDLVPDPLQSSA